MQRVGARAQRSGDDAFDIEIGLCCRSGANQHRLVSQAHVQRVRIRLAVDCDGAIPLCARCCNDAAGNLATVGNEQFFRLSASGRARPGGRPFFDEGGDPLAALIAA